MDGISTQLSSLANSDGNFGTLFLKGAIKGAEAQMSTLLQALPQLPQKAGAGSIVDVQA